MQDKINLLTQMGDYLYTIDDVRERNAAGFNRIDKDRWLAVRHNATYMADILKKYHRQLSARFGAAYDVVNEFALIHDTKLEMIAYPAFVAFRLSGRTEHFNEFKATQKEFGMHYKPELSCCVLYHEEIASFDVEDFRRKMSDLEIELVGNLPEVQPAPKVTNEMSPEYAWSLLDQKRGRNLFCLRYMPEKKAFVFRWSFSQELNHLFSNKSGQLSGIFLVNTEDWSRETTSLAVAKEAVEKARKLVPSWTFAVEDLAAHEEKQAQAVAAVQKPVPEVVEKLADQFTLFPFQNEFVRFLNKNEGRALIGAEMGLGKTLISLSWVAAHSKRVLVVCPKVVRRTWVQEAQRFFPGYFKGIELRPDRLRKEGMPELSGYNLATVNFASFEKFLPAIAKSGFDTLIIDESHYIKNEKAQITRAIYSVKKMFAHKILLSGTAIKNKKSELYTQIELIRPGTFSSKEQLKNATIGLTWSVMQDFYLTKTKEEVLKDLPEKMRSIIDIEVPNCPDIEEGTTIGDLSRLKANVARAKAASTVDFVKEIIETSDSAVLVFTDSVDAAIDIQNSLGEVALLHHGQMRDDARESVKQRFQAGEGRVFVSTRQSLAVGATLTRADKVVFNDLPWTPSDIRQAEDRAHRIGQKNMVNVYWLKAQDNEWDSNIISIIWKKFEISKKVLEGKQVTPEEKAWLDEPISLQDVLDKIKRKIRKERRKNTTKKGTQAHAKSSHA